MFGRADTVIMKRFAAIFRTTRHFCDPRNATARRSLFVLLLSLAFHQNAFAWVQEPSPLNEGNLALVRPTDFTAAGKPITPAKTNGALFGQTVNVAAPVQAETLIRAAGDYALWIRVAEAKAQPITVELVQSEKELIKKVVNQGQGAAGQGGPEGLKAYRQEAISQNAEGGGGDDLLAGGGDGAGDILNELRLEGNPGMRWINSSRIEDLKAGRYLWWKVGTAALKPGFYTLRVSGGPAVVNAAFLTTVNLTYPYGGDIDVAPASYIRFRVDDVPRGGLQLTASLRIHANPYFQTSVGSFSDEEMSDVKTGLRIKKAGYTPWYKLQDLEHAPGFGGGKAHLILNTPAGARGATQFSTFPHGDEAVREIDWNEPEGKTVTFVTDFKTYLSQLRTFLDHAREHYDYALSATGERLFPLIRSGRYFGTGVRGEGESGDYALKTMRLIGTNVVSSSNAPANRKRYGWASEVGHGWDGAGVPFNEEKTRERYVNQFKGAGKSFTGDDVNRIVSWYLADEPGEAATTEMTAPFWKYYGPDRNGPRWVDFAGGSDLNFKRTDLSDFVMEGKILKLGRTVGFSVGFSDPTDPNDGYGWYIGAVSQNRLDNFAYGKRSEPMGRRAFQKPEASISDDKPTPFKIVYEGTSAVLYLNGKLVHLATDLPPKGGIGFTSGAKAITALEIRPIRGKDRGGAGPKMADPGLGTGDIKLEEFDDNAPLPDWAKPKPLEQMVKEDFVETGGIPEARIGFRKWAAKQGVKPELFGKTKWDDVNLLTIKELAETAADRRLYYWSRRYASYLTPLMFSMAAEAIRDAAPNKDIKAVVALSGHSLYFPSAMPLDMFALAEQGGALTPGISDFMSTGLRWDSQQAIAFSIAPYHSGARVYPDKAPAGWPTDTLGPLPRSNIMMHCGWSAPTFNAYTQMANGVEHMSYYHFGPEYVATEWYWSESPGAYVGPHKLGNRAAQVDDILEKARVRPSRVAMLYSRSTEYWNAQASFTDKRASFLGLSHEYYQPELVTEEQVAAGALDHYDAMYVLEPWVSDATQARIKAFVERGGLLWTCADALRFNEFGDESDFLKATYGLGRSFTTEARDTTLKPAAGETAIVGQATPKTSVDKIAWADAKVRASFGDGRAAWLEKAVGKGRVVYLAFRAGASYTGQALRIGGEEVVWGDSGRVPLTLPLNEARIARELILSQPSIMAQPLTSNLGTLVVLYNMQGDTARNVNIRLKAKQAPKSVQAFDEMKLVDVPFTFRDGFVEVTLPALAREQIVAFRDTAMPVDDRPAKQQALTREMLASTDWQDLTAGAFFAGFNPTWNLGDRLVALLTHENGMVRRAAAEAIARLKFAPAANALATGVPQEKHPHAAAEMLIALAALNDDRFPAQARAALQRPQAYIHMKTLVAASGYLRRKREAGKLTPDLTAFAKELYSFATTNNDSRVYGEAVPLLAAFEPQQCLTLLADPEKNARYRSDLLATVANDEALLAAWLAAKPDYATILSIASLRRDDRLAAELVARLDSLPAQAPGAVYTAAKVQGNPALTRGLFARHDALKGVLKSNIAVVLERTFNARIGENLDTWREYVAKLK